MRKSLLVLLFLLLSGIDCIKLQRFYSTSNLNLINTTKKNITYLKWK